jgi:hypothetical protein
MTKKGERGGTKGNKRKGEEKGQRGRGEKKRGTWDGGRRGIDGMRKRD